MIRLPRTALWLALSVTAPTAVSAEADGRPLGWTSRDEIMALPADQRPSLDATCPGTWVTPIPPGTAVADPTLSNVTIQAENVHYDPNDLSTLRGSVSITQPGRRIDADNAELASQQGKGRFSGNILIAEPGLVLRGDRAEFDFDTNRASIERTEFVSSQINAHGHADRIIREADGRITIARGQYTTCEPGNPAWHLEARDIRLNQATGRGDVRHATLHIRDVPVLYVPYFNFPIDDRRQTGLLTPRFGNTNDGGFDLAQPVYLNLAPNYDATLTPRLITERGSMLEGELRYLLPYGGSGILQGTFMPNDQLYDNLDRKSGSWRHQGQLSKTVSVATNVNYVSDTAYFTDLGTDLNLSNTTHQERVGDIYWQQGMWSLLGRVQAFQTIDPTIPDALKPYSKLPQLLLNVGERSSRGLEPQLSTELTYFHRRIDDGSGAEVNGARYKLAPSVAYRVEEPWGHFTPRVKVESLLYQLEGAGVGTNNMRDVTVPTFSLDTGLVFEREQGSVLQTLEPRAFYLFAPFQQQDDLPNFDTATTTFSYAQLFRDSRFSGGDRLDDANQLSLGLTSRLIDGNSGDEIIRASIGQIAYLRDRKVGLYPNSPVATDDFSGFAAELVAPIGRGLSVAADGLWSRDQDYASQYAINFNYLPENRDRLANVGYHYRREDLSIGQKPVSQASLSFVQPIGIHWQLLGLWQYDFRNDESQDALLGVQYEKCCWRIRLFQRQFLTDPDDLSPGAQRLRNAFFFEFELKGLAGFGSSINSLLGQNVFGYNQLLDRKDTP